MKKKKNEIEVRNYEVGYTGTLSFSEDGYLCIEANMFAPYIICEKRTLNESNESHVGIDVFSGREYYFFSEMARKGSPDGDISGKNAVGKSIPLKILIDKETTTLSELKSVYCNFNLLDAFIHNRNDENLILLKKCLEDIDIMDNEKNKEKFVDMAFNLTNLYLRGYKSVVEHIALLREEIDNEKKKEENHKKRFRNLFTK